MALHPDQIGERIRKLRGDASQADFARLVGASRVSVARYESGERTPDAEFVASVFSCLGVDPAWLLLGDGVMPSQQLTAREAALISKYRAIDDAGRKAMDAMAAALGGGSSQSDPGRSVSQTFHGPVGASVTGDATIHQVTHAPAIPPKGVRKAPKPGG